METEDWSQSGLHVKVHVIVAAAELPEPDDNPPSTQMQTLIGNDERSLEDIAAVLRPDAVNVVGGTDGALLWGMFAECLASLCMTKVNKTRVPGTESAIEEIQGLVWSDAEFSLARYRLSEMLDLDHLSSPQIGL